MSAVVVAGMRPYIVRQGDYVAKIAARVGCGEDEIWEHPKNASLHGDRRSVGVLNPGDVLYVPVGPQSADEVIPQSDNCYRGKVPRTRVRLVFKLDGEPRTHRECVVSGTGDAVRASTDGDGALTLEVPTVVRYLRVTFQEPREEFEVAIGHIDPTTETSGVRARLRQLGYLQTRTDDALSLAVDTRDALACFQHDHGLPETGEADEATRESIEKAFGS